MTDTDKDYDAAADWAEHDMTLPTNSDTALLGDDAARVRPLGARAGTRRTAIHRPARGTR
jgi:hypothetical protein